VKLQPNWKIIVPVFVLVFSGIGYTLWLLNKPLFQAALNLNLSYDQIDPLAILVGNGTLLLFATLIMFALLTNLSTVISKDYISRWEVFGKKRFLWKNLNAISTFPNLIEYRFDSNEKIQVNLAYYKNKNDIIEFTSNIASTHLK